MSTETKVFNISDVFFSYIHEGGAICTNRAFAHLLIYVVSGEMTLTEQGSEITVHSGECVFIRRDHRVSLSKYPKEGKEFQGITMMFTRGFLKSYFQRIDRKFIPAKCVDIKSSVIPLPESAGLKSIFGSLTPYFESDEKPSEEVIDLKMQEGVLTLLSLNKNLYSILFDFTDPWKIDILKFLNENYMYELSQAEIATYTGRSLATFKRDFKKISDLSPQKWLIYKRLEVAEELIREGRLKVSDICTEVGFKNRSHFTTIFKKQFGYSPSEKI